MKRVKKYLLAFELEAGQDLIEALESITAEIKAGDSAGFTGYYSLYSQAYRVNDIGMETPAPSFPKPANSGWLSMSDNLGATASEALALADFIRDITK